MKIKPQKDSSITDEINIELGDYTILAGENNSGKTNLIRAIKDHEDLKNYKKIFVPAEHIQPQNEETKNSAAKTEFYKLLKLILEPIFDKELLKDLTDKFNNSEDKKNFVSNVNKIIGDFGVKKKKFDVKIAEDEFKEDLIIKITKAFAKDLYKTDVDEVDFENIGMGTQRLIVAALIQYYQEKEIGKDEEVLIIFEEPEVYLHPKWKNGLYDSLLKLSEREKTKVLITTHDPYFIELGKDQNIYQVHRDEEHNDATAIRIPENEKILLYKSAAEINYVVFDLPSKTYFLELYEYLLSFFDGKEEICETCKKNKGLSRFNILNKWILEQSKKIKIEIDSADKNKPLISNLRHQLSHPDPRGNKVDIKEDYMRERIKELSELIKVKKADLIV